jgi:hypothetical protein
MEIYVSTFPAGGGKWQVSQIGGGQPQWGSDGRELHYEAPGGKIFEAGVTEKAAAVEIGVPNQLFQLHLERSGAGYAVAPDGKRFLVVEAEQKNSQPLTPATNWTASLGK